MNCYRSCVSTCQRKCDTVGTCTAVVMTYIPGVSSITPTDIQESDYNSHSISTVANSTTYGQYQCGFVSCTHLQPWNGEAYMKITAGSYKEYAGQVVACPKNASVPLPLYSCPSPGPTSDCTSKSFQRKRHNTLWLPGAAAGMTSDTVVHLLKKYPGAYDTISMPWAWWNSQWNTKCTNDTAGLCGRQYSAFSQGIVDGLHGSGYRFVPMLQVCAECVLNGTWNWRPAMELLISDAKTNGFAGCVEQNL